MSQGDDTGSMKPHELQGWKEIAEYLNRSVRTAQRWEREFKLPVRRLRTAAGETVYAVARELDEWKESLTETREGDRALREPEAEENGNAAPRANEAPAPPPPATDASPEDRPRPAATPGRSIWPLIFGGLALVMAVAAVGARFVRSPGDEAAADAAAEAVLDPGPWPANGHDMQRTNRSHLKGPAVPGVPRLLYQATGPEDRLDDLVVTIDRKVVFATCGAVVALDPRGRQLWTYETRSLSGLATHASGFAANSQGVLFATARECPDVVDSIETYLYEISGESAPRGRRMRPIGTSHVAPAIGPDRNIYTIDEIDFLRGFRPWLDPAWGTTLAGFMTGGIALDRRGNLYVGTDGGRYHQTSFWSVAPDGEVRWSALRGEAGLPLVTGNRVYVASLDGQISAFTLDGRELWSQSVGAIASLQPLALGPDDTLYVQSAKDVAALRSDGTIKWRRGSAAPAVGTRARPLVDADGNIFATMGDEVVSFAPDGRTRWRLGLAQPWTIVAGDERLLYVTTGEKRIYAIGER